MKEYETIMMFLWALVTLELATEEYIEEQENIIFNMYVLVETS